MNCNIKCLLNPVMYIETFHFHAFLVLTGALSQNPYFFSQIVIL